MININKELVMGIPTKGTSFGGKSASQYMAKKDLYMVISLWDRFISASCMEIGALLAGIASRESNVGAMLSRNGYGDNGHAYGIMQVDRRYHGLIKDSPIGPGHIGQATKILMDYIEQVEIKHPTWSDEYKIKGGIVAYNSGIDNVQTIDRMDIGTTNNDYSDDVIARAQLYYDWL